LFACFYKLHTVIAPSCRNQDQTPIQLQLGTSAVIRSFMLSLTSPLPSPHYNYEISEIELHAPTQIHDLRLRVRSNLLASWKSEFSMPQRSPSSLCATLPSQ